MKRLLLTRIQKTGGTSLQSALSTLFPAEQIAPYLHDFAVEAAPAEELVRYRFFAGHISPRVVRKKIGEITAITVLREPVERLISAYAHWHWYGKHKPEKQSTIVRRIGAMSLSEFLTEPEFQPCVRDVQHRILHDARFGLTSETRMLVSVGTHQQTDFLHVGCLDRLQETADFAANWLGLPAPRVPRLNTALMRPEVDSHTLDLLEENTLLDAISFQKYNSRCTLPLRKWGDSGADSPPQ